MEQGLIKPVSYKSFGLTHQFHPINKLINVTFDCEASSLAHLDFLFGWFHVSPFNESRHNGKESYNSHQVEPSGVVHLLLHFMTLTHYY